MLNGKAPNGLLVAREPYNEGPLHVGWADPSMPAEAMEWETQAAALAWADENAPSLAVALRVGIADKSGGYNPRAVRLVLAP